MAYRISEPGASIPGKTAASPKKPDEKRRHSLRALFIGLPLVVAAGAGGYWALGGAGKPSLLPDEETMRAEREQMRNATPEEREALMRERRERMEAMTPEERRQMRDEMRARMQERHRRELKEYFAADAAGRQAILDRQLDEMASRMNEMRGRRGDPPGGPGGFGPPPGGGPPPGDGGPPPNAQAGSGDGRGPRQPPTQEQRNNRMRDHLENSSPLERAQREKYMSDLRQRASQRGINMRGPGGGPRR